MRLDFYSVIDIDAILIHLNSRLCTADCKEQIEESTHDIFYRLNRCLFHYVFQLRMEEPSSNSVSASEEQNTERCTASNQMVLPLELRITHFREMLLERGVRALKALKKKTFIKPQYKVIWTPAEVNFIQYGSRALLKFSVGLSVNFWVKTKITVSGLNL